MIRVGINNLYGIESALLRLKRKFNAYSVKANFPKILYKQIFPDTFLSSEYYLVFPLLFKQAFGEKNRGFVDELCLCGYLYFKYLICVDSLNDKDLEDHENKVDDKILLLRSHVFHQESLKILGKYFGGNKLFWTLWGTRNSEFLESIAIDNNYNIEISFEQYEKLSTNKCSFLKTTVDSYYSKYPTKSKLHAALVKSFDYLAIARCIQDDLEDFKKDLLFKKNNIGHSMLNKWFNEQGKVMNDHSPAILERYLYVSKVAETMLGLSRKYFTLAIDAVKDFRDDLLPYTKHLEAYKNKNNLIKVNIEAYQIAQYFSKLKSTRLTEEINLNNAIERAEDYISKFQNSDGSWYDISNKQGISNVWATGFIASQLDPSTEPFKKAINFLLNNRQNGLWGYNTDWISDFDSTTCVLLSMLKDSLNVNPDLDKWIKGQTKKGGFSTYSKNSKELLSLLGLRDMKNIKGWTEEHVCVSALAYYLLSNPKMSAKRKRELVLVRNFILRSRDERGLWPSYWWTSKIYASCYAIKGLLNESNLKYDSIIKKAIRSLIQHQNNDGSFSCDVLKTKSVFYTSLVLSTVCYDKSIYLKYEKRAEKMKMFILKNQFDDGGFQGSNFLVIPQPNSVMEKKPDHNFKINIAGGGNAITGEVSNLFSTSVALNALTSLQGLEIVSTNEKV